MVMMSFAKTIETINIDVKAKHNEATTNGLDTKLVNNMKIFYATSVMTRVTVHGNVPPTYVANANAKVIPFGSAPTQQPWRPWEMKTNPQVKTLHS